VLKVKNMNWNTISFCIVA